MKHICKALLLLLALATATQNSYAQDATTQGKEFWLSFIANGFKYHPDVPSTGWVRLQLIVSAKRDCEGTITNPNTGWTRDFTVEANDVFSIDLDEEQVYIENSEYERVVNKGLKITTTDTVSVYCANIATYSFDASFVLPTPGLADDYIIQTYDQSTGSYDPSSAFVIVATEDDTEIDITPSVNTLGGHQANQTFSITLNAGEAYQVRSNMSQGQRDLSGTRVTAHDCKKIAIFNGNNLTLIPTTAFSDSDCVFEQAMPVRSWGKKFVVTSSLDRNEDYVKITSASDGNEIRRNGTVIQTLNANQSYVFKLNSSAKSCYLETSQRSAVYLFNSSSNGSGNGAPSMVWIAPIEQRIEEITFSTFNYNHNNVNISNHYVNIIVESQDVGQVYLDNNLLPSGQFEPVEGNNRYSFYRKRIDHGVHQLNCPNGFNAHIYGFGDARGYAYMAGSKAADLTTSITVNETPVNPYDTITECILEDLSFSADINLIDYNLIWDFGDGTTSTGNPVSHHYENHGVFVASLTVTTEEPPCGGSSTTNTSYFYIDLRRDPDQEINDAVCFRGPDDYTENGFNLHYDSPGTYHDTYTVTNESGCESYVTLNLTVSDLVDSEPVSETGHCDTFEWYGNTYTSSGYYTDTVPDTTGCYTIRHLNLELQYSPDPTDIYPSDTANTAPHWVITATEFQIKAYEFELWDNNPLCKWDSVSWNFPDSKVDWVLEPIGDPAKHCKVYVLSQIEDTVWLQATVSNDCCPQGKKTRYWLLSSFYGVEENNTSDFNIDIAPNPNNGTMNITTSSTATSIDVKVYNMTGQLVDQFVIPAGPQTSHPYHLDACRSGMYCFTFSCRGQNITKKVIITK